MDEDDPLNIEKKVRIKVQLDITKPLRRGIRVELPNKEQRWLRIQYEILLMLCYWCGKLGHVDRVCAEKPTTIPSSVAMSYGPWLRVSPQNRRFRGDLTDSLRIKSIIEEESSSAGMGKKTLVMKIHGQRSSVICSTEKIMTIPLLPKRRLFRRAVSALGFR